MQEAESRSRWGTTLGSELGASRGGGISTHAGLPGEEVQGKEAAAARPRLWKEQAAIQTRPRGFRSDKARWRGCQALLHSAS